MAKDPRPDPASDPNRLRDLEQRIATAQGRIAGPPRAETHFSQANHAWRMVIELVAGLGIGFGIGYGLDYVFGTLPIFLVVFVLLGFAAGIKVMLRTAAEISGGSATQNAAPPTDDNPSGTRSGKAAPGETGDDDGGN